MQRHIILLLSLCLLNTIVFAEKNSDSSVSSLLDRCKNDTNLEINSNLKPLCSTINWCLKSQNNSDSETCQLLSPVLSLQTDNEASSSISSTSFDHPSKKSKPDKIAVWGYGFLCVTIISLMSVLGVGVLPFMSKAFYSNLLTCLIGLAVGSLAASAIFHLIPSAFLLSDLTEHHSYLNTSMVIWLGIYLFFVIERLMKIFMECRKRDQKSDNLTLHYGHSHGIQFKERGDNDTISQEERNLQEENGCVSGLIQANSSKVYEHSKPAIKASFGLIEKPKSEKRPTEETIKSIENGSSKKQPSTIQTVAWMIIFGDGVHNFIDGLSIGAAFTESILTGISVSLAVLCEEFPHELGDFAVLLNAGMSVKQAMLYNFLSACTCYLGLVIGILLGGLEFGNNFIFALAGGMFLYIALVDMIPELNETMDNASKVNAKKALFVFLLQNIGIGIGITFLFLLAKYQDDIVIGDY